MDRRRYRGSEGEDVAVWKRSRLMPIANHRHLVKRIVGQGMESSYPGHEQAGTGHQQPKSEVHIVSTPDAQLASQYRIPSCGKRIQDRS